MIAVLTLSACDPYEEKAAYFESHLGHYVRGGIRANDAYSARDILIARTHLNKLNKFVNSKQGARMTPSLEKLFALRSGIVERINQVNADILAKKYRPELPVIGTGALISDDRVTDHAFREYLSRQPDNSVAGPFFVSILRHQCRELRTFMESEFPNKNILERFQRQYNWVKNEQVQDHQLVLVFDITLGRYDAQRQLFPVKRISFGEEYPTSRHFSNQWEFRDGSIHFNHKTVKECRNITPHNSKRAYQVPETVEMRWDFRFNNVLQALEQPIAMSPDDADTYFRNINPEKRSVFALAYFDRFDWQSTGTLEEGHLRFNAKTRLRHVEYYLYQQRKPLDKAMFFDVDDRSSRPLGGIISLAAFNKGRPMSIPIASKTVE